MCVRAHDGSGGTENSCACACSILRFRLLCFMSKLGEAFRFCEV